MTYNQSLGTHGAYAIRSYLTNRIDLSQIKNGFLSFCINLFQIEKRVSPFFIDPLRIKKRFIPFCINLFWIKKRLISFRISLSRIKKEFILFCGIPFWIKERDKRFCKYPTLTLKRDAQDSEGLLWAQSTKKYSSYLVARLKQLRDISTA